MFNHCGGHVPAAVRAQETLHWGAEMVGELGGLEAAKTPPTVGHRVAGASGEEDRPLLGFEHLGPETCHGERSRSSGWSSPRCSNRLLHHARPDDFPLSGLVYEAVTDPKLHRQDAACGGRCWLGDLDHTT